MAAYEAELSAAKAKSHADAAALVLGTSVTQAPEAKKGQCAYELDEGIDFMSVFNNVKNKRHSIYSSYYKKFRNIARADGLDAAAASNVAIEMGHVAVAAWRKQEDDGKA